jgi:hypothetical protein
MAKKLILTFALTMTTLLAFFAPASVKAQGLTPQCMEGVYTLEEMKRGEEVYKPPQISGRWMILNGVVMWIFHDYTNPSGEISYSGFGRYTVNTTGFAYRYDDMSIYTHAGAGISKTQPSQILQWEGMRLFTPVIQQDGLHLRNMENRLDYFCSADEVNVIAPDLAFYRKYHRVKSD